MQESAKHRVFVVSDGSGATADRVVNAALTQFDSASVVTQRRSKVRSERQVRQVVREAAQAEGCIVHTLVMHELRDEMLRAGRMHNVETIDLMGPLLGRLSQQLSTTPDGRPGLFRELNQEYFRRIEAMEFAIHHDDGRRAHELDEAEIVLVGVSRTFKTPLSIYLAFKLWFVANVPIIWNREPPPELLAVPQERVFGLSINPTRLADLRLARQARWGTALGDYADPSFVRRESAFAQHVFRSHPGWRVIDVTDKPVEEIAAEIVALKEQREE